MTRRLPIAFVLAGPNGALSGRGYSSNVSLRGICISADLMPRQGQLIKLGVSLPSTRCSVEGRVVWTRRAGRFDELPVDFGVELRTVEPAWIRDLKLETPPPAVEPPPPPSVVLPPPVVETMPEFDLVLVELDESGPRERARRIAARLPVRVRHANGTTTDAETVNVSATGIALHTPAPQPLGSTLELSVTLPGSERTLLTGTVVTVRRSPYQEATRHFMGLRLETREDVWDQFVTAAARAHDATHAGTAPLLAPVPVGQARNPANERG